MNAFRVASRKLFRKGEHTATRIISLAIGLAFGLILLSEVFYYYSYEAFYPNSKQIYVVNSNYKSDKSSDEQSIHPRVSGAIGPGLKAEVPGIEAATRLNTIGTMLFYSEDDQSYNARFVLADMHLHEVLPRPMISGVAKDILQSPLTCMVSDEIAEKMGGNIVGKTIEIRDFPGKKLTIGGVFKRVPENTNFTYDIAISMTSTHHFTWDGTENWLGNDRYYTCVKLEKGVSHESLAPAVRKMQEKHQDIEKLEKENGVMFHYSFQPIQEVYANQMKNTVFILSAIALIVLFVSIMNYMLLTISTLANRSKTSAVYKCYGAEKRDLQGMIFAESTLLFGISLILAFALIILLKPIAEAQVGHSLNATLNANVIIPILLILGFLLLSMGYFPGRIFAQTPVAAAFRTYKQNNTRWKKTLLAVQFTGAALILAMLTVVSLQYEKIKNADHGYTAKNVYYTSVTGMNPRNIQSTLNEIIALPEVEIAGLGYDIPISGASGNNVMSPDGERDLFNVADFYYIDEAYFSILEIPVVEGQKFEEGKSTIEDVMISKKGADLLVLNNGWNDGVVGQSIPISEHGYNCRITGVHEEIVVGNIQYNDTRPSVFFYLSRERFIEHLENNPSFSFLILIKTHPGEHPNIMDKLSRILNSAMIRDKTEVHSLAAAQENTYQSQKGFRNAVYAGSLVVILVTVMGLLGYLNDEIARYRKSLAIRKINGATATDIVKIFVFSIAKLAVPCVLIGLALAWLLGSKWMQNFPIQISLSWWIFVTAGLIILLITGVVAILNSLKAANTNPVESLKYE